MQEEAESSGEGQALWVLDSIADPTLGGSPICASLPASGEWSLRCEDEVSWFTGALGSLAHVCAVYVYHPEQGLAPPALTGPPWS